MMGGMHTLRVGTRTSALALAQASAAARSIVQANPDLDDFEIVGITTHGDTNNAPLTDIGGTGLFTSALREALLEGECDIAIHSAKDLPAANVPGFSLFFPPRANPYDALCAKVPFRELPQGAKVGTGSPRRAAQLQLARPDLEIIPIRGNVPTRLARIDDDLDGVVLACAGLERLGLDVGEQLSPEIMVPAPTQGTLGLETLTDSPFEQYLRAVEDPQTRATAIAERAFMSTLGAGCTEPLGALAQSTGARTDLHVRYTDGRMKIELRRSGSDPYTLGADLAHAIRERGMPL